MNRFPALKQIWIASACLLMAAGSWAQPVSREVTFKGAGGLELKGTLVLPSSTGKFPAMLLLPGSGPTDRNGNQAFLQTDLLKQLAEGMAKAGIASLRFDKRAVSSTYMASYPQDIAKFDDFISWESHLTDVRAAFKFAQSQSEIDPAKVGVLGHSEGAMFAMELATDQSGPACAILASAPGRPLGAVARDQIKASLERNPQSGIDAKKLLADYDKALKGLLDTKKVPADVNPLIAPLFPSYASKYLYTFFSFQPAKVAPRVRCPVLVVQAEKDIQILMEKDAPALLNALKVRSTATTDYVLIGSASHNLKAVKDPNKDPGFEGPVVPLAIERITGWLKKVLS